MKTKKYKAGNAKQKYLSAKRRALYDIHVHEINPFSSNSIREKLINQTVAVGPHTWWENPEEEYDKDKEDKLMEQLQLSWDTKCNLRNKKKGFLKRNITDWKVSTLEDCENSSISKWYKDLDNLKLKWNQTKN